MRRLLRQKSGSERAAIESAIAEVSTKIELPGLGLALLGGLISVVMNPAVLDPKVSGVWFFVKMPLFFVLFVAAFVKMVNAERMGAKLDIVSIALGVAILFVTVFRFALFK